MKVSVDVDCTPEEARRLMGLPDMTAIHDAYTDKMKRMMEEGITPDALQSMIGQWMPMGEAGMSMWRSLLDQIGRAGTSSK
ncbi:DUF6489 family protein [Sphingomonas crocodyli]|uniref:Uncharacterized protein n=1 Tax=Sphingomonas crocodyli TaxID=1979270 RepID=A0A437M4P1_9SPHN|nr:DUF6489 family protein [Sphingomonas crocodyli]RVT92637.1 hypothetical protein EOD43_01555 [Sphingomonas crocodyli]